MNETSLLLFCLPSPRLAESYSPIRRTAFFLAAAVCLFTAPTRAQDAARPEVRSPLQAAQALLRDNRFAEALLKVREADGVKGKTSYERYLIEHTRGRAAAGAGDNKTAIKSFEAALASNKAPAGDELKIVDALAGAYYRAKNYPTALKWATRYFRDGGTGASMRTLLIQSYYQSGDTAKAAREAQADILSDIATGRPPSEDRLLLLANCHHKQNNPTGYLAAVEKLLTYYPKKHLWAEVISGIRTRPDFSDRLTLDVYRLQRATGNLTRSADYMEMARLALQAGYRDEAKKVVDEGHASRVPGMGAEVARQKRLKDLMDERLAEPQMSPPNEAAARASPDGNALVDLGFHQGGNKGIALMEAGIKKGGLTYPEDARLHLGILLLEAGQKVRAAQVLNAVQGTDGVADLARLWLIYGNRASDPGGPLNPLALRVFWTYFAQQ